MASEAEREAFIRAETAVHAVPHAPEIRLHLADEAMDLWEKTEEELGAMGLPPPFWAFAWAGGQALARYILDHPEIVAGRRAYDFAAGSGLVAIAAAKAGAAEVTASEIDAFALIAIRLNAELNGVTVAATGEDATAGDPPAADVLFCGDVFYEKPMAAKVLAFLDRALEAGIAVYVGDPGRSYLPKERLELAATYEVPVIRALEDAAVKKTSVFTLKRWPAK
ncbi:class I SAM-dependent methyltransferase [Stappia albiluteola]|nr:methyltransferase [Stappia albiluteola]